jgi:hypothetical protein
MSNKVYFKFFNPRSLPLDFIEIGKDKTFFSSYINTVYKYKLWSTFKPQKTILKEILRRNININMNDYILCPIYGDESHFSDFQFGATETRKEGESEFDNLKRCLSEELGLKYESTYPPKISLEIKNKKNYIKMFFINITGGEISPNLKSENESKIPDDKNTDKSGCIVYGSESDILNFLSRDKIIRDKSGDILVGITAISFRECVKFFNK